MTTIQKRLMIAGALLGAVAVCMGALGAHTLKPMLLKNDRVLIFELAVRYQFYHALLLLMMGILKRHLRGLMINYAALMILSGSILFSGSLYLLALNAASYWAMVTPFGGVALIVGWLLLMSSIAFAQNVR